jgi:pimeloyl-ACP methyl ester carboxylesterase
MERIFSDGLEIAAETFGNGKPLIFAHGLTGARFGTRRQFASFADEYRLITYDQRGHGDSTPVTDPAKYNAEKMADDLGAVLDHYGIERAIVGGESMGSATALLFALKYPARVEKLLLTAPAFSDGTNPGSQGMRDNGNAIAKLGMEKFLEVAAERQRTMLGWSPQVVATVAEFFRAQNPASIAVALQAVPDWIILDDLAPLAKVKCPVCVIAWDNDIIHPFDVAQRVVAAFPNATLQQIPTLPEIFIHPEIIGDIYRKFLETH